VLDDLQSVLSLLKDAETGQRGFIITGLDHYLDPYHSGVNGVEEKLKNVRTLTSDNANQQPRLDKLMPLVERKFEELAQTIALRKEKGFDAAAEVVLTDAGKQIMDDIRTLLGQIEGEERSLLKTRSTTADATAFATNWMILGGTLVSFLLVGAAAIWTTRSITQPVRVLVKGAKRIGGGDLNHRTQVTTNDELGELSRAFDEMAGKLQAMVTDLTDKKATLTEQYEQLEAQSETLATQEEMLTAQAEKNKLFDAIRDAVNRLSTACQQILATTSQQASGSQEQAAAVSETVATVEEVASTADQATQRSRAMAEAAQHAGEVGGAGREAVDPGDARRTRARRIDRRKHPDAGRAGAGDRRNYRHSKRHRRADQRAGAERRRRSFAGRRVWQRLRRRRVRSKVARPAIQAGHRAGPTNPGRNSKGHQRHQLYWPTRLCLIL